MILYSVQCYALHWTDNKAKKQFMVVPILVACSSANYNKQGSYVAEVCGGFTGTKKFYHIQANLFLSAN